MTLKEINTKFSVNGFKDKGKYLVFSKTEEGIRMRKKYLCLINKKGDKYFVDGFEPTNKLNILEEQINKHITSLPYNSEYYMPLYRKGVFEEFIIRDYLNSLGFKSEGLESYSLMDKNIYQYKTSNIRLTLNGLDMREDSKKEVKIYLWTGKYSWIETVVKRNVESIKKGIDTLLKPLLVSDSVNLFQKSEKLSNVENLDIYLKGLTNNLDIVSADYKQTLKHKLQELVDSL